MEKTPTSNMGTKSASSKSISRDSSHSSKVRAKDQKRTKSQEDSLPFPSVEQNFMLFEDILSRNRSFFEDQYTNLPLPEFTKSQAAKAELNKLFDMINSMNSENSQSTKLSSTSQIGTKGKINPTVDSQFSRISEKHKIITEEEERIRLLRTQTERQIQKEDQEFRSLLQSIQQSKQTYQKAKQRVLKYNQLAEEAQHKINLAKTKLETNENQIETLKQEEKRLLLLQEQTQQELNTVLNEDKEMKKTELAIDKMQTDLENKSKKLNKLNTTLASKNKKVDEKRERITALLAQLKSIEDQLEDTIETGSNSSLHAIKTSALSKIETNELDEQQSDNLEYDEVDPNDVEIPHEDNELDADDNDQNELDLDSNEIESSADSNELNSVSNNLSIMNSPPRSKKNNSIQQGKSKNDFQIAANTSSHKNSKLEQNSIQSGSDFHFKDLNSNNELNSDSNIDLNNNKELTSDFDSNNELNSAVDSNKELNLESNSGDQQDIKLDSNNEEEMDDDRNELNLDSSDNEINLDSNSDTFQEENNKGAHPKKLFGFDRMKIKRAEIVIPDLSVEEEEEDLSDNQFFFKINDNNEIKPKFEKSKKITYAESPIPSRTPKKQNITNSSLYKTRISSSAMNDSIIDQVNQLATPKGKLGKPLKYDPTNQIAKSALQAISMQIADTSQLIAKVDAIVHQIDLMDNIENHDDILLDAI